MRDIKFKEVEKIFDETNSKWDGDNAFQGLLIIAKYFDIKKNNIICGAGHDEMCSVDVDDLIEKGMTKEEFKMLAKLNWCIDEDFLKCFV